MKKHATLRIKTLLPIPCIAVLFCLLLPSCSSLYSTIVNEYNIDETIAKEKDIPVFLENVLDKACDYAISVCERIPTHFIIRKKTKLMRHLYYVIKPFSSDEYSTLSFFSSGPSLSSRGVWILNSNSDVAAYEEYLAGKKSNWDFALIETADNVDTAETIKKLIAKIENRVTTYYYRDHLNDKPGVDNCNTAVLETLVRKPVTVNN